MWYECSEVSLLLVYICFALTFLCCSSVVMERVKQIMGCRKVCGSQSLDQPQNVCVRCQGNL